MRKTGFLYDERFLAHKTGPFHPEVPERLTAIQQGIKDAGLMDKLTRIEAEPADMKWIEAIHTQYYIKNFKDACLAGEKIFYCPDNQMCMSTFDAARLAVGGILRVTDMVMDGRLDNAFCAVRPPGHHAETDQAMGFCYFANVALAARYLIDKWGIKRVGVVDFDVHHGNGTQHIFEQDPSVFYYSIHEHPSFAFPGTGREFEDGKGEGKGFTKNSPILPGGGDEEYKKSFENDLFPAFDAFKPEVIIVSAGFDAHVEDNMSRINLSTGGFSWMMKRICEMADSYSGGRALSILEGGYSLKRLPELAGGHVNILMNGG
ncbi:Histone deacetylase [Candidatus Desulfarcum epimagneticum]|uniref:Histone deacetylase n=1 Tax=uncultured Desulfobacteraceae bacterium TaxID=218296 RepID=A0A484HDT9_9BACT|nr:Histone deacetylase [uncultured Desulfobacteraceae bacterium]